jgi:hypothetical protein
VLQVAERMLLAGDSRYARHQTRMRSFPDSS